MDELKVLKGLAIGFATTVLLNPNYHYVIDWRNRCISIDNLGGHSVEVTGLEYQVIYTPEIDRFISIKLITDI